LVIEPEPITRDHVPVPLTGIFALRVALPAHTYWFGPALAIDTDDEVIVTSSIEGEHPLLVMVHRKTLFPAPSEFTAEVGDVGLAIVPVPLITLQLPEPIAAIFPARLVVALQTD